MALVDRFAEFLALPGNVQIGLRAATQVDRVEIRWPSGSGKTDVLTELVAGQFYSVLEGSGVVPAERIRPTPPAKAKPAAPPANPSTTPQ